MKITVGEQSTPSSTDPGFAAQIIAWQKTAGRHDLPWQGTGDAYRVWLSEIMLQQTRVQTVIPYYQRFLARWPTLAALAAAPLNDVLEAWAGLGYYARARNLHRCAQVVMRAHDGVFSADPAANARLPGIGRSTAAAISVFSFGTRAAVLDANVRRVLSRCFPPAACASPRALWALAESLLPQSGVACYTQGMMDLGATVCRVREPDCARCPLRDRCYARLAGEVSRPPAGKGASDLPERRISVVLLTDGRRVLLERRPPTGVWGGLLSLPETEHALAVSLALRHGCQVRHSVRLPPIRHTLSHFRMLIEPLRCEVETGALAARETGWEWLPLSEVDKAALPAPIRKLMRSVAACSGEHGDDAPAPRE